MFEFFVVLFLCALPVCMSVPAVYSICRYYWARHRQLWPAVWRLGIELRSSRKAINAVPSLQPLLYDRSQYTALADLEFTEQAGLKPGGDPPLSASCVLR